MISKKSDKLPNMHNTNFRGLPVIIQWPKSSLRVGEREDGTPFKSEMKADYGYIPGTEANGDEERLDVYLGPDEDAPYVYAIEQLKDNGEFDEYKLMLGFSSLEAAEEMYLAHNDEGWETDHVGDIQEIPFEDLLEQVGQQQQELKTAAKPEIPDLDEDDMEQPPSAISRGNKMEKPRYRKPPDLVKAAVKMFGLGTTDTERYYILPDGRILDCDDNDHFAVEAFYPNPEDPNESLYDSEDAINQFITDTGALRGGLYEGSYLVHLGGKKPTDMQIQVLMGFLKEWEVSVTFGFQIYQFTSGADLKLPEHSRPIEVRRAIDKLFSGKKASHYTLIEAFVKNYEHEVDFYQEVAGLVQDKLDSALQDAGIKAVVSSRAKRPSRLEKKLRKRSEKNEYQTFRDITDDVVDLAGCRVALYMPADRDHVGETIQKLFTQIRETKHFPQDRGPGDTLGYVADHYLVKLKPESLRKKELRYADTQVEIQVASVLMHAWAEVTHDLVYKPEKGKLTGEEMKLLKDLNDLVQLGEAQLEKLQTAIENRTSEDLRFDVSENLDFETTTAALKRLANFEGLTIDEFKVQARKIAGIVPKPQPISPWATYLKARLSASRAKRKSQ